MESADQVCRLLALAIYQVRQQPTAQREAQVLDLRRTLMEVWVALNVGRISPQQAAPRLHTLAQDIQHLQAQLESSLVLVRP